MYGTVHVVKGCAVQLTTRRWVTPPFGQYVNLQKINGETRKVFHPKYRREPVAKQLNPVTLPPVVERVKNIF